MHEHASTHRMKTRKYWMPIVVLSVVGGAVYLFRLGSTGSWPETRCTVAGSRVVRADVADSFRAIVMYSGEYQLRHSVGGHDYYVWAKSGWFDIDREFAQSKVDYLPNRCDFRVRYNPSRVRSNCGRK
jgi:hypothetical protein